MTKLLRAMEGGTLLSDVWMSAQFLVHTGASICNHSGEEVSCAFSRKHLSTNQILFLDRRIFKQKESSQFVHLPPFYSKNAFKSLTAKFRTLYTSISTRNLPSSTCRAMEAEWDGREKVSRSFPLRETINQLRRWFSALERECGALRARAHHNPASLE